MDCDNKIFQLEQQAKRHYGPPAPRNSDHHSGPTPMELDALTHGTSNESRTADGKLTQQEKDRRRREGLCVFDGRADCPGKVDINQCPNLLKKKPKSQNRQLASKK